MQGKGLVKALLILMCIVSAIQFFYFIPSGRIEGDADDFAETAAAGKTGLEKEMAFRAARSKYLDSVSTEKVFNIDFLGIGYTYSDLKSKQLNLGLDLKGGMSTLLEVDLSELLVSLAGRNAKDAEFLQAIEKAKLAQTNDQSNFVTLFVREYRTIAQGKPLARIFAQSENLGGEINNETKDGEVERLLRLKADQTVDLTYKMLKERIDRLGVVQPNITLDKARDIILVELPGIDNPERARQFLQKNAELEFWETFRTTDAGIMAAFAEADKRLSGDTTAAAIVNPLDTNAIKSGGPLLSLIEINNPNSPVASQNAVGLVERNRKELVMEYLSRPEIASLFPKNLKFMWSYKPFQDSETKQNTNKYQLYAIKTISGSDKAPLNGEVVTQASGTQDPVTGEPQVQLSMNATGAKKWAELTTKAYQGNAEGARREIAITLDKEVVTAPSVNNGPITGGISSISGSFTVQEASDLAKILEVGKLPAKTKIIQESNVGPSMGKENIQKSLVSILAGFLFVLVFMVFYYARAGFFAVVALLANLLFIVAALSSFGTVLTLPGIAGLVLTIGMAVDANVIINERVKEELRAGKSLMDSMIEGFKMSLPSIIDANVTTIIVGILLAYFGLGPIKGFAVVLIIGIVTTMFTAILLVRYMADSWVDGGKRNLSFYIEATKNVFTDINVDWVSKRKYGYIFSSIIIIAGMISAFTRGFDYGVDFSGGYSYNVQFAGAKVDPENIRTSLEKVFESAPIVKEVDVNNTFNIITNYGISTNTNVTQEEVTEKLYEGLKPLLGTQTFEGFKLGQDAGNTRILNYNKVGATVADDISKSALMAGILSLIAIFLYILFRFNKWQYSLGAIIALIHDALATISLFTLLRGLVPWSLEVNQEFVAAILTIIGYSINDTVIIFDRIREYLKSGLNVSKKELINLALNKTFSRTIFTSFTVLLVVLVLFLFGGTPLKNFSFALLVGVIFGSYSTIFIATPILVDLSKDDLKEH